MDLSSTFTNDNDELVNPSLNYIRLPSRSSSAPIATTKGTASSKSLYSSSSHPISRLSAASSNEKIIDARIQLIERKRRTINSDELYYNLNDYDSFDGIESYVEPFESLDSASSGGGGGGGGDKRSNHHIHVDNKNFNNHHDVTYERINLAWFELAIPATLLTFSICGCICLIVFFLFWAKTTLNNLKQWNCRKATMPFSTEVRDSDDNAENCARFVSVERKLLVTTHKQSKIEATKTEVGDKEGAEDKQKKIFARMDSHETNSKPSNSNEWTDQIVDDHRQHRDSNADVKLSANIEECKRFDFNFQSDRDHHVPDALLSSAKVSISRESVAFVKNDRSMDLTDSPNHLITSQNKLHQSEFQASPPIPSSSSSSSSSSQTSSKSRPSPLTIATTKFASHYSSSQQPYQSHQHQQQQHSPQYTRSVSASGDVSATSSEPSANTDLSRSRKISSNRSSESPIMSPSYIQNKQYRSNVHRMSTGNYSSMDRLHSTIDNKENAVPVSSPGGIHSGQHVDHRLDSPKFALTQQNSQNTPLSNYKSPPSTHSSPMYTAHETRTDCNIFTYSPLINEPYKHSTYFHFPDVDTPSPLTPAQQQKLCNNSKTCNNNYNFIVGKADATSPNQQNNVSASNNNNNNNVNNNLKSSQTTPTLLAASEPSQIDLNVKISGCDENLFVDTKSIQNEMHRLQVSTDECCSSSNGPKNKKEVAIRRARLKSISLDSDGARLVEENLCIPVEELVERTLPQTYTFNTTTAITPDRTHIHSKCPSKNVNHLVLDLSVKDDSLPHDLEYQSSPSESNDEYNYKLASKTKSATPKTPTLAQTRQKAVSLDSEPNANQPDRSYRMQSTPTDFCHPMSLHSGVGSGVGVARNKPQLLSHFLDVETNSSMSVPTTPKRQQIVKNTLNKLNASAGKSCSAKKMSFASSAEYFSGKKGSDRKCGDKLQLNPETEPILEGTAVDYYDDAYALEHDNTGSFETTGDDIECEIICGSANSLISNFGNGHGNLGNVSTGSAVGNNPGLRSNSGAGGLSLSNYSLSNFQGSHCSLTRSNYNIFGMTSAANACGQSLSKSGSMGCGSNISSGRLNDVGVQQYQQAGNISSNEPFCATTARANFCVKKNLLQRRGSNTSLTLNIVGGSTAGGSMHSTLNRFNSHSSLNVMSTPFDIQRNSNLVNTKKGLLERRNSNASLTLNIQKRALSTSNCYLRGSDLSLSSGGNNYESHLEEHQSCSMCDGGGVLKNRTTKRSVADPSDAPINADETRQNDLSFPVKEENLNRRNVNAGCAQPQVSTEETQTQPTTYADTATRSKVNRSGRRKFLSSENLNIHNTFSLCQPPIKTSSVVDLNQSNNDMMHHDTDYDDPEATYCSCSNNMIRNITTKPLSPQTTSEDFKIYLANIQILQNASNLLTDRELTVLGHVFNRSYERASDDNSRENANKMIKSTKKSIKLPSKVEQNCLLTNLHQEFWELPTNYQEKPLVFGSQAKNRYKTILPNEHSRVILEAEKSNAHDVQEQPTVELYINANYIKGPDYSHNSYIATQGPMSNTIYDFWLMVYQNCKKNRSTNNQSGTLNADALQFQQKIIMLTDIIENDESKCAIYFPQNQNKLLWFMSNEERRQDSQLTQSRLENYFAQNENSWNELAMANKIRTETISSNSDNSFSGLDFNFFCVKNIDVVNKGGYTIRKLHCLYHMYEQKADNGASSIDYQHFSIHDNSERKLNHFIVYHYWFPHWPDHRSPENIDVVLDMCINLIDSDCDQEFMPLKTAKKERNAVADASVESSHSHTDETHKVSDEIVTNKCISVPINQTHPTGPIPIIHCSAGIGRTGCVAAILNGLRQMRQSYLTSSMSSNSTGKLVSVDVLGIVSNLRLQRGGMVQNSEQYELIHRALCLYHQRFLSNTK